MQELQQTQNRPRTSGKSVWLPLVLLIIPTFTFLLFLLLSFGLYLSRRWLLWGTQPAWLHFFLTHQKLFSRMFLVGLLCSGLDSLATILWLRRGDAPPQAHHAEGAVPMSFYIGGGFLLVALATAAAYLYKRLQGPQSLIHSHVLDFLITECIFPIGLGILFLCLIVLVAWTSLSSVIELFARLKRPASNL